MCDILLITWYRRHCRWFSSIDLKRPSRFGWLSRLCWQKYFSIFSQLFGFIKSQSSWLHSSKIQVCHEGWVSFTVNLKNVSFWHLVASLRFSSFKKETELQEVVDYVYFCLLFKIRISKFFGQNLRVLHVETEKF